MDADNLKSLVESGLSTRQIAATVGCSQTNVRHWLDKHGLVTTVRGVSHLCCVCRTTDPTRFYGNKKRMCGRCQNQDVIERSREKKKWAVDQLGGKCVRCGYGRSMHALQFHHRDPSVKDKNFGSMRGWSKDRIRRELEGCDLLCANCHAEVHEEIGYRA